MKKDDYKYITKTNLQKDRNWSKTEIGKFLQFPDLTKPNTLYRNGSEICLYLISKVEEVEKSEEYITYHTKTLERKNSSKKVVETKKKNLFKEIDSIPIEIPKLLKDELYKQAVNHYNQIHEDKFITIKDFRNDIDFANRICVNFIRHELTDYDDYFEKLYGKVGNEAVLKHARKMIYKKIGSVYPYLKEECKIQFAIRK